MHAQLAPTDFSDTFLSTEHLWPPPGRTKTCCRLHVPKKRGKETRKDEKPTATLAGGSNRTAIELHAAVPYHNRTRAHRGVQARGIARGGVHTARHRGTRVHHSSKPTATAMRDQCAVSCMHPEYVCGELTKDLFIAIVCVVAESVRQAGSAPAAG